MILTSLVKATATSRRAFRCTVVTSYDVTTAADLKKACWALDYGGWRQEPYWTFSWVTWRYLKNKRNKSGDLREICVCAWELSFLALEKWMYSSVVIHANLAISRELNWWIPLVNWDICTAFLLIFVLANIFTMPLSPILTSPVDPLRGPKLRSHARVLFRYLYELVFIMK